VRLALRLVRMPERTIVASFSRAEHVAAERGDLRAIAEAFDDALGKVMRRVVEWTLRTGEAQRRR
jgi:cholesterol transport system auxiliary component